MAQTTAAHQKIWCRHPVERRNAGQKSSSQRSVCRSPTSLTPTIAGYAEVASVELILTPADCHSVRRPQTIADSDDINEKSREKNRTRRNLSRTSIEVSDDLAGPRQYP